MGVGERDGEGERGWKEGRERDGRGRERVREEEREM